MQAGEAARTRTVIARSRRATPDGRGNSRIVLIRFKSDIPSRAGNGVRRRWGGNGESVLEAGGDQSARSSLAPVHGRRIRAISAPDFCGVIR